MFQASGSQQRPLVLLFVAIVKAVFQRGSDLHGGAGYTTAKRRMELDEPADKGRRNPSMN